MFKRITKSPMWSPRDYVGHLEMFCVQLDMLCVHMDMICEHLNMVCQHLEMVCCIPLNFM